ncbi:protein kinase (incomplete catalytic triad) [Besnoitia besnoiti]|uniref:Protein kinase (Incomplete catalytic triad) n=1 Tax=Besnoitia besnoiti TaxID=94643 RepID=A0A2A9MIJ4_BESBE|nr:protein kinase (incomplete catalytic triad) [Besnoitia besnoiti]PFH35786.1 protein kinase (incomplete catalytic triad) [Besnoitia besnoiti]
MTSRRFQLFTEDSQSSHKTVPRSKNSRIEVGSAWVKTQVAAHLPPESSRKNNSISTIYKLLGKTLFEGNLFLFEQKEAGGTPEEFIRGPIIGAGACGLSIKGTFVSAGHDVAMKIHFSNTPCSKTNRSRLQGTKIQVDMELRVRDALAAAFGAENILTHGMVLSIGDARRVHGFPEMVKGAVSTAVLWNSVLVYPLMKCSLNDLLSVPGWPREARLYVAKRLIEILSSLHRAGVVDDDSHAGKVALKEGSGDLFFTDFGEHVSDGPVPNVSRRQRQLQEASHLGHLVYYAYTGKTCMPFWLFICTDNVPLDGTVDPIEVGPEELIIQDAIRAPLICNEHERILPQDITAATPLFRDEPHVTNGSTGRENW